MRTSAAIALRQRIDIGAERRMTELHRQIIRDGASFKRERDLVNGLDAIAEQCIAEMAQTGKVPA